MDAVDELEGFLAFMLAGSGVVDFTFTRDLLTEVIMGLITCQRNMSSPFFI